MKILLIEDEERMNAALCEMLRDENYDADGFLDGAEGFAAAQSQIYDLIILDVMLPGMSGFDIAARLRELKIDTPILMLTAKDDIEDKVCGLDSGADDYLTKPFEAAELTARIRALLRRSLNKENEMLKFADISLDAQNFTLINNVSGKSVRLTDKELKAFEYLLSNKGRVLSREQLALKIWGWGSDVEYNNVEVYMSFLRKKLKHIESRVLIKSVRGVGYELREG